LNPSTRRSVFSADGYLPARCRDQFTQLPHFGVSPPSQMQNPKPLAARPCTGSRSARWEQVSTPHRYVTSAKNILLI